MKAYKSFRLYMTKARGGTAGYFAVSRFELYTGKQQQGANVLTGGTASASSTYNSSRTPDKAFDGDEDTTWESLQGPDAPKWLQYDLPSPVVVQSIYVSHKTWEAESPMNFRIEASNDGVTWEIISTVVNADTFTGRGGFKHTFEVFLSGKVTAPGSTVPVRIYVFDWLTGVPIMSVIPDPSTGEWTLAQFNEPIQLGVMYLGPPGFRPRVEGPILPIRVL